jgi:hypothetical protein
VPGASRARSEIAFDAPSDQQVQFEKPAPALRAGFTP